MVSFHKLERCKLVYMHLLEEELVQILLISIIRSNLRLQQ